MVGAEPASRWWHDRPGAARGLIERLREAVRLERLQPPVVVVLEGAARPGCPAGELGGVRVVHAAGSGDDELVTQAQASLLAVVLVSADQALRARAARSGATAVGPRWLLARLEGPGDQI